MIHKAIIRRWARIPTEMYVDDESMIDLAKAFGSGQKAVESIAAGLGNPFADKKKLPMCSANLLSGGESRFVACSDR